ncbi:MAG: DegT/DnrJ/EryC1/StrS family aminotransferase, partial [Alphaproteobacteria bacterium]|nr:DegT/DnrJ/EryC1/StrS family aminotransferase [Alphaproteobacteria bacterium]
AVISLFHVVSYQTTDDDAAAIFATATEHLRPGGLFLFDIWYGPAVLSQQPAVRVKRMQNEQIAVTRTAEPMLHPNANVVDVHYEIFATDLATGRIERIEEDHSMRYPVNTPDIGPRERELVAQCLAEGWVSSEGPWIERFEAACANRFGRRHAIAVTNGSAALDAAVAALGLGPGDEVIVPSYTFVATASAVALVGAVPVFVDIQPSTYNIDPDSVEAAITPRTRAIIAVHIAGRPADLDRLTALAKKHDIRLIEDAAQAHAAAWKGQRVGAIGDLGTFSFQASKNLNAGEGGFITTSNSELAQRAWSLHNCGRSPEGAWYEHPLIGGNYRLGEFQAGLLLSQLKSLDELAERRSRNGEALGNAIEGIEGIDTTEPDERITTHAYHLFVMRYSAAAFNGLSRDHFIEALNAEGIPCSAGYRPLYGEPAFT